MGTGTQAVASGKQQDNDFKLIEQVLGGGDGFSDRKAARYFLNLIRNTDYRSPSAYRLCHALEDNNDMQYSAEFPVKEPESDKSGKKENYSYKNLLKDPRNQVEKEDWALLEQEFSCRVADLPEDEPDLVYKNLMFLADYLELNQIEKEILQLVYTAHASIDMRVILETFLRDKSDRFGSAVALMLDRPKDVREIMKALSDKGKLATYGLLVRGEHENSSVIPDIDMDLREDLGNPEIEGQDFIRTLIGEQTKSDLELEDFSYLGDELDFLVNYVKSAVERGDKGINILLYGPPGSGKTELARTIAKALDYKMYAVGEQENTGPSMGPAQTARHRLQHLHFADALLKGQKGVLINFEEPEDLLLKSGDNEKSADSDSKIELNRLLENNDIVRIWTANDPQKFHAAVRQRFAFSLHMGYPPTSVRKKIWERQFALKGVEIDDKTALSLARKYATPPRLTAKAAQAAAINPQDSAAVERVIISDSKLVFGHREAVTVGEPVPENFNMDLLNSDAENLKSKVEGLIERGKGGSPYALFIKGQNGSGAASLTRYMAEKMAMNIMEVSLDGLAFMQGGQTSPEQILSDLFNQAADSRQFLVLRDIQGLVCNPHTEASDNWNSSLVKAFKASAWNHKLPFVAINHSDAKLPDSFRHFFSHDIALAPLTAEKARLAYRMFFDREAPVNLDKVDGLLPGDFAHVVHALSLRDTPDDIDEITLDLLQKQRTFRTSQKSAIGIIP